MNRIVTKIIFLTVRVFMLATFLSTATAQPFNPYYNFKHLNVENGLAQNVVYHFLQDSRGYMWLGTRNGVTVYDGTRTIIFQHDDQDKKSISGNFITRILEDSNHSVWIGNDAGIDRYNPTENNFTHYGIPMSNGHKEDTYCVLLGFSKQYELWFIDTKSKAIKIFNTRTGYFRFVTSTDAVDGTLYYDPGSGTAHIWTYLSISSAHLIFGKDSLIREDRFFNGDINRNQPSLLIYHVFIQNDSTAWLSTAKGLIELNPLTQTYSIYNTLNGGPVTEIRYVSESPKGLLWVGSGGFGIYTFDIRTKKFIDNFRNYPLDPFSICSNNIVSLYFDRVGNIWCGSFGNGVSYANVENNFFSKFLSKNEMDHWKKENSISWIGSDNQKNVWCILQDVPGFCKLDSSLQVEEYRMPTFEDGRRFGLPVHQLFFDGPSTAWCTTYKGLFRYNTVTNRIRQVDFQQISNALFGSYWSNVMIRLHDSSLLFSTFGGIYRISRQNGRETILPFSPLNNKPNKSFDMIFEDREHNIYVSGINDSLYILSPTSTKGDYSVKKSFAWRADIIQFQEFGEDLYLATNAGLFVLHKNSLVIEKSPINKFLPFTSISDLLIEGKTIWLFGEKGLYYFNTMENSGRLFNTEDGLPSDEFKEFCMFYSPSGKCLVGTNNGLLSFYPGKLQDNIHPPRPQLINMYVNDSSTGFLANPQGTSQIKLEHYQNTFSFDFSSITFQHAAACTYLYKLEGYDDDWVRSGNTHYTRYSRIPPGKYIFRLRVIDPSGKISPHAKTLEITIGKAFWQTLTFKIFLSLVLAGIIAIMVKWYLSTKIRKHQREFEKQQVVEKERTRIATDMHDDLGAGLSSIRFLSEKVKLNTPSHTTKIDIDKILISSSELIDKMNEIVWALNVKNDSLGDLLFYIRSYAKEYCEENELQCEIRIPENIPGISVSGEIRRNIFLTIKESLHNIVKHAKASRADIEFRVDSGLSATIRDNGGGLDTGYPRKETAGNGLRNMRKRMESIGGSFRIYNRYGVVIEIEVPLSI